MPSDDPIILNPPPTKPTRVVDDWREGWKFYSVWGYALVAALPDLYAAVVAMGWLNDPSAPEPLVWALRGLGVAGIVARFIRQTKPA